MIVSSKTMFSKPKFLEKPYGWLPHIPFAFFLVETLKPRLFVELGTHIGNSYFSFCQAADELKLSTTCYAVDTWEGDQHASFYGKEVFERVKKINTEHFYHLSYLLRMKFDDALQYFSDESIDLLHIDGCHTYEAVKHDYETWLPKISKKGVILFHDTNAREKGFGVWKLFEEIRNEYPSMELLHGHGLGLICVGSEVAKEFLCFVKDAEKDSFANHLFSTLGNRVLSIREKEDLLKEKEVLFKESVQAKKQSEEKVKDLQQAIKVYEEEILKKKNIISTLEVIQKEKEVLIKESLQAKNQSEEKVKDLDRLTTAYREEISENNNVILKLEETNKTLRADLHKKNNELESLSNKCNKYSLTNESLKKQIERKEISIKSTKESFSWRITKPIRFLSKLVHSITQRSNSLVRLIFYAITFNYRKIKRELRYVKYERVIKRSGLFDSNWYNKTYPDVKSAGVNPITHYIRRGADEGRNPGPKYSTKYYLKCNPDVAEADINPFAHYILYGKSENRSFEIKTTSTKNILFDKDDNRKIKKTALVITWDVGHNPLGRSYMLAEVLDRIFEKVIIVGFQFPKYGQVIWEPLQNSRIPVISFNCKDLSDLYKLASTISRKYKPDIVFSCKTRLPSILLGLAFKREHNIPLVADIDDHELAFVNEKEELSIEELLSYENINTEELFAPYSSLWTRAAVHLREYADQIIVSNPALHRIYGGQIIPHVRDEIKFDPSRYNKTAVREKYNIPSHYKIILFFGTPRFHKGINVIAETIAEMPAKENYYLLIVGDISDKSLTKKINNLSNGRVIFLANQPFDNIPEIVLLADIVCLPQNIESEISKYQLPAKAIDAIGMNIPLLITKTEATEFLFDYCFVEEIIPGNLKNQILKAENRNNMNDREVFIEKFSYKSASKQLRLLCQTLFDASVRIKTTDINVDNLFSFISRFLAINNSNTRFQTSNNTFSVVVFWKQNDSGIYGRRSDMIIKYLASRPEFNKVIVFDQPISETSLKMRIEKTSSTPTEHRAVFIKTYQKYLGVLDVNKVSYKVFIYHRNNKGKSIRFKSEEYDKLYLKYIRDSLKEEGVDASKSVFWFYPKNFDAKIIMKVFSPALIVSDVVDDHRSWPNISQEYYNRLTENYRFILKKSNLVYANCLSVKEKMSAYNSKVKLIENGCDDNPPISRPINNRMFIELERDVFNGRKVIGYAGNLESKINIPLIKKIIEKFNESKILLIGSTHANEEVKELKNYHNVILPGVVEYHELGSWLKLITVAVIPHLNNDLTQNMNPLKAFVYISHNLPVVCSVIDNIPNASELEGFYLAKNDNDFLAITEKLLNITTTINNNNFVKKNSWESRFKHEIDEILIKLNKNISHEDN